MNRVTMKLRSPVSYPSKIPHNQVGFITLNKRVTNGSEGDGVNNSAIQSQKAVTTYLLLSKQLPWLLPFGFAEQNSRRH